MKFKQNKCKKAIPKSTLAKHFKVKVQVSPDDVHRIEQQLVQRSRRLLEKLCSEEGFGSIHSTPTGESPFYDAWKDAEEQDDSDS